MSIDAYQLLPEWAVLLLGHWLPWVELAIGLFLMAGILLPYVAASAAGMLAVFFGLMARAFIKGMTINCGCFGLGEEISAQTLVRDGVLVALAIALTILALRRPVHASYLGVRHRHRSQCIKLAVEDDRANLVAVGAQRHILRNLDPVFLRLAELILR